MSRSSDRAHSDRPNLEQKRKLAKELLKAVGRLEQRAAARFTWNHPRFRGKSATDVLREGVTLTEAQHVIARESGFDSWPKLRAYIQQLDVDPHGPIAAFEDAVRAIIRGDAQSLAGILRVHPEVATMRSRRQHHAVLPHYIAANGVEDEHQVVPPNAPEIAKLLMDAGGDAVVDATADFYGGGPGSTPLVALVSSTHPHEVGVQAELVRIFCDAGANVNGISDDCLPLCTALGFRYPKAALALADCGARVDNLPAAAGLGLGELVEAYLDGSRGLVSQACEFPNPMHDPFPVSVVPHPDVTMQQALVFASMCGHVAIAKRLLDNGVDVNGGPRRGITALHEACYQGRAEIVHLLLQHGASTAIRDEMWRSTAIGWAQGGQQSALVAWLLESADVDILDAVEFGRHATVRHMLEADRDCLKAREGVALRIAVANGDVQMVELLLEFGGDPTIVDQSGHSAIDYAEKAGQKELLSLLRRSTHVRERENEAEDE